VIVALAGAAALAAAAPGPRVVETLRPAQAPRALLEAPPAARQWANGPVTPPIAWRSSRAVGLASGGRLVRGVRLPAAGPDWFTWDPIRKTSPNRPWRRWGTDRLLRTVLRVVREYRAANPGAPRVGIGDLSRRRGGDFGRRFGGIGHASHQNGLDADIYYPRRDRRERRPPTPGQVDRRLAQDLVDRFAAVGAEYVFVGPRVGLRGKRGVVTKIVNHDDHLHVRLRRR
jgi:murein endopeptidase